MSKLQNTVPRKMIAAGRVTPVPMPLPQKHWNFGDRLGDQLLVEVPFTEIIHEWTRGVLLFLKRLVLSL